MVEKKRVGKSPFPSHCRWARRENKGVGSGVFLAYLHTYIRLRNAKAQHDSKYRGSKEKIRDLFPLHNTPHASESSSISSPPPSPSSLFPSCCLCEAKSSN